MHLSALPPDAPFLDTLAAQWLAGSGADAWEAATGLILLPTRRAARALAEAFLRASGGRPLLLPRIAAIGALDEAPLALAGALNLPPAVEPAVRLAALSRLILAMEGEGGAPRRADAAWRLAGELAGLLDEAARAELDLAAALPGLAGEDYAVHWQMLLRFLRIVTRLWPGFLADGGMMDPAARQVALLHAQARAWQDDPPAERIWAAGMTGAIPALARLLGMVARLPQGRVILPGLDHSMDEAAWQALDDSHPQAGLRRLLDGLGATRADVAADAAHGRAALLSRVLLPAAALGAWRAPAPIESPPPDPEPGGPAAPGRAPAELAGLRLMRPADQQEEAVAIALALRDAIGSVGHEPGAAPDSGTEASAPANAKAGDGRGGDATVGNAKAGRRAALVTPDRALAVRVAAELLRFGIIADDSAGEPLAQTPPAVFLRLLAQTVAEGFTPVGLLALLKHPLTAAGLAPAACRDAARALELACLRGPRPAAGLDGLRRAAGPTAPPASIALLDRLDTALAGLTALAATPRAAPAELLAALVEAAEALAATPEESGPERLWAGEEGEALAVHLAGLLTALAAHLPDQPPDTLPALLEAMLEGQVVRGRRALRGREGAEHPRVFIWGLLEARLQSADLLILGGLAEGVWPPATDPGPWLSRPMRAAIGLPAPEQAVGQAAHDFVMACCAAPAVVLSCPRRRDGAPAVPARWLVRLEAYLAGRGAVLPAHPAVGWARALDRPAGPPRPAAPPQPRPQVALRPRRLSVTAIETWLRDPYAIYARYILDLRRLDPLDQATDAADYGRVVHEGVRLFLNETGIVWPADARARLRDAMDRALAAAGLRPALYAWWRPRLRRIADWVAETEAARRQASPPLAIAAEVEGAWRIDAPAGAFLLTARADRIERRAEGEIAILDYKTGTVPSQEQVAAGLAPQLPLEGAMAEFGAFGEALAGPVTELVYWRLTGGFVAGQQLRLCKGEPALVSEATEQARAALAALVAAFDDPARAYLARPDPAAAPRFSDYAQLSRAAEWQGLEPDAEPPPP
jgi:ATP-dependent helicase/nuclease subunit B